MKTVPVVVNNKACCCHGINPLSKSMEIAMGWLLSFRINSFYNNSTIRANHWRRHAIFVRIKAFHFWKKPASALWIYCNSVDDQTLRSSRAGHHHWICA
jgi:hypothetical protein